MLIGFAVLVLPLGLIWVAIKGIGKLRFKALGEQVSQFSQSHGLELRPRALGLGQISGVERGRKWTMEVNGWLGTKGFSVGITFKFQRQNEPTHLFIVTGQAFERMIGRLSKGAPSEQTFGKIHDLGYGDAYKVLGDEGLAKRIGDSNPLEGFEPLEDSMVMIDRSSVRLSVSFKSEADLYRNLDLVYRRGIELIHRFPEDPALTSRNIPGLD